MRLGTAPSMTALDGTPPLLPLGACATLQRLHPPSDTESVLVAIMALAPPTLSFTALGRITAGRASHQPSTDHLEPRSTAAAGFNAIATTGGFTPLLDLTTAGLH